MKEVTHNVVSCPNSRNRYEKMYISDDGICPACGEEHEICGTITFKESEENHCDSDSCTIDI